MHSNNSTYYNTEFINNKTYGEKNKTPTYESR